MGAQGAVFSNAWVALLWLSDTPSLGFYPSLAPADRIHGHHHSQTRIVFDRRV